MRENRGMAPQLAHNVLVKAETDLTMYVKHKHILYMPFINLLSLKSECPVYYMLFS